MKNITFTIILLAALLKCTDTKSHVQFFGGDTDKVKKYHLIKDGEDSLLSNLPPLLVLFSDQQPRAGQINYDEGICD